MYFKVIKGLLFLYEAVLQRGLPEVGDLQRSSEVLDPSLESQSAVGATKVVIKHSRMNPPLRQLLH